MKTKLILLSLLGLLLLGCRRPSLPKPGEPTLNTAHSERPAIHLPWRVMKGQRFAHLFFGMM
ncbi:MAG: hypothetical protein KF734_21840 [Saprospiraceae bacterium]|nr:hypothetical protein [Saprospiraceae bacterium]